MTQHENRSGCQDLVAIADRVLCVTLSLEPGDLSDSLALHDVPAWGSLVHVELMIALRDALPHELPPGAELQLQTVRAIRAFAATGQIDAVDATPPEIARGLSGVVFDESSLTSVDAEGSALRYLGYDVRDLAELDFVDTVHLLLVGALPDAQERDALRARLAAHASMSPAGRTLIAQRTGDPLLMLAAVLAATTGGARAGRSDPVDPLPEEEAVRAVARLVHATACIGARDEALPDVGTEPLALARHLLLGVGGDASCETVVWALNACLVLQADHGANASTFAGRVAASTGASLDAALIAALATFGGPLHGGAVGDVVSMLERVATPGAAHDYVRRTLAAGGVVPGFGHRVYQATDPRVTVLERVAAECARAVGHAESIETIEAIRDAMATHSDYGLHVNVDAYLGAVFRTIGIGSTLAPAIFACGRVAGWAAHWIEQRNANVLIRPRLRYVGPRARPLPARNGEQR